MASYHSSFTYNGLNSAKDMGLIIAAFASDTDNGLTDTFLSMDISSDDYYDGTKRYTYNSRYNTQATVTITVVKNNGKDFSLQQVRSCFKWLTGAKTDSWLDMYNGDEIKYSFLGRVTNVQNYKLDARIVGLIITFTSVSPWAYSAPQVFDCSIYQLIDITEEGVLLKGGDNAVPLGTDSEGILSVSYLDNNNYFNITDDGVVYIDNSYRTVIDNQSDDLYTYIYLDIDYINESSSFVSIRNITLGEETKVTSIRTNESISISAKQFIISDVPNKIFGDTFNFVWPRLQPGLNDFIVEGDGRGSAKFTYRYPMKVGDCAMDITIEGGMDCSGCDEIFPYDTVPWEKITGTPTSIGGYGINNAYTKVEVDQKIEDNGNANISEAELQKMLTDTLG